MLVVLMLAALTVLVMPMALAQEDEHDHEHEGVETIVVVIFDIIIIIAIILATIFGLGIFGGMLGTGLKYVFAGLIVFGVNFLLTIPHHFNANLLAPIGITGLAHEIFHQILILIAFSLVAYGFYKIKQATKS